MRCCGIAIAPCGWLFEGNRLLILRIFSVFVQDLVTFRPHVPTQEGTLTKASGGI